MKPRGPRTTDGLVKALGAGCFISLNGYTAREPWISWSGTLLLFLGQLTPALGPVQLYEYDFPHGPYRPSFLLGSGLGDGAPA